MQFTLETALEVVRERQQKGHPQFYRPLVKEASQLVKGFYRRRLSIPEHNAEDVILKNDSGTVVATGYRRVVIGDYGAFVEVTPAQISKENISPRFQGEQSTSASYIWHQTNDVSKTKIYLQQHTVQYADYIPGMYYISPEDVFIERVQTAVSEWKQFTRIDHPQHQLEAKRALGGEPVGDDRNPQFAVEGQWLCRNPENNHMWTMGDKSFGLLYKPLTREKLDSKAKKKMRKNKSEQKASRKKLNESEQRPSDVDDLGPLFEP